MTKAPNRFANPAIFGAAIFCAALLLMLGLGAQSKAHADDFAAGNAALLDPFDPVPQIRFSDCYDDCGYRRCYRDCGRRQPRRPSVIVDERSWCERMTEYDYNTHRWDGSMERYDDQADQYDVLMKDKYPRFWHTDHHRDTGPSTGVLHDPCFFFHGPHAQYADYEWRQESGHWRYWHGNDWHDDGFDDRWHDGHHDRH